MSATGIKDFDADHSYEQDDLINDCDLDNTTDYDDQCFVYTFCLWGMLICWQKHQSLQQWVLSSDKPLHISCGNGSADGLFV